ncbi:MAG: cation transporter [Bacteroidota bacterium]
METIALPHLEFPDKSKLYKYALYLSIFTIVYNIIEGLLSTWIGFSDESLTLFGFGVDSFIETVSGIGIAAMVLRIAQNPNSSKSLFEVSALKVTGWSFYILAGGLVISSILSFISGRQPESTFWGVIISLVSIVAMIGLIYYKKKIGTALDSKAMIADANCNLVCIYMSLTLLGSSFLYEMFALPYVDAAGALGLVYFSIKEGKECFEKAQSLNDSCSCAHD